MAGFNKLYVNDIGKKLFVIPSYQRGYRWTQHNVTQLLDDLASFTDTEYCLQPLVLQKIEESQMQEIHSDHDSTKWDEYKGYPVLRVVDGQQRLTTISLIVHELGIDMTWDIYYSTEGTFLSDLISSKINNQGKKNINGYFRGEAISAIRNFQDTKKNKIKGLFSDGCNQKICFLEYCINKCDNDHDTFRRLNDGKTPLTSSELIRALYMVNSSAIEEKDRLEISKEWELMEQTLQNEQFWLMFNAVGLKDTPTRVDLLFALVLGVKLDATKANPLLIFETLDSSIRDSNGKATDKHYDLVKVWHKVLRCFWWMQSCYDDIETFNYLCWIAQFTDNRATTIYRQWYTHSAISEFKKNLIVKIQNPFLAAIANGDKAYGGYWVASSDLGRIHIEESNISMWIEMKESDSDNIHFCVERNDSERKNIPIDLNRDVVEQGRELLGKLLEESKNSCSADNNDICQQND